MRNNRKKIDRKTVARSLRELELLFGKKPPDRKDNAAGNSRADTADKLIRETAK